MLLTEIFDQAPMAKMKKLSGVTPEMLAANADVVKTVLANRLTLGQVEQFAAKLNGSDPSEEDADFQFTMLEKLARSMFNDAKVSILRTTGKIGNVNNAPFLLIKRVLPKSDGNRYVHYISGKIGFAGTWVADMKFEDRRSVRHSGTIVDRRVRADAPEEALEAFKKFFTMWEKRGWEKK